MNRTTGDRTNYTLYASLDGGNTWAWGAGLYAGSAGYSSVAVLGTQKLAAGVWRVDVAAAFQLGHNLPSRHVEGGGYDGVFARASITVRELGAGLL